ncbi:hypothetical protein ACN20G_01130 [Streptomyces sp. BI20]|uniref:hypothetical protein n=1 Tax=Streptomyces sp. BI20 TaxID=3403460 RepID=UPI003C773988
MDETVIGPSISGPQSASSTAVPSEPWTGAEAFTGFLGREFATALQEGLRRSRVTSVGASALPSGLAVETGPAAAGLGLLRDHAEEILLRFESAMPLEPGLAGPMNRRVRVELLTWARQVLGSLVPLEADGAPAASGAVLAAPHRQTTAVSLLIESASLGLPFGSPAGPEAIRALARAVRGAGSGARHAAAPAVRARMA